MNGTCQCGAKVRMGLVDGNWRFLNHACAKRPLTTKGVGSTSSGTDEHPSGRLALGGLKTNAKKTTCGAGHRHASKMEAGVCDRLTREYAGSTLYRLVQQIRLPLLLLAEKDGRLKYITVDFGVFRLGGVDHGTELVRLIEAKNPKRVSRDWPARKRACELSWGLTIEEVDR